MDWNNKGIFDLEESSAPITTYGRDGQAHVTWNNITVSNYSSTENTYLRLRNSSDPLIPVAPPLSNITLYSWEFTPNGEIEDYIIPINAQPLPSDLISFHAKASDMGVELDWTVSNQKSMKQYNLYKSIDGVKYNTLTSIPSDNSILQHLNVIDSFPNLGMNIYQLRSEELDGTIKVMGKHQIVHVNNIKDIYTIYPNPASSKINITISPKHEQVTLFIYNSIGQLISTNQLSTGNNTIDISNYDKGIYIFELNNSKHTIPRSKITIN